MANISTINKWACLETFLRFNALEIFQVFQFSQNMDLGPRKKWRCLLEYSHLPETLPVKVIAPQIIDYDQGPDYPAQADCDFSHDTPGPKVWKKKLHKISLWDLLNIVQVIIKALSVTTTRGRASWRYCSWPAGWSVPGSVPCKRCYNTCWRSTRRLSCAGLGRGLRLCPWARRCSPGGRWRGWCQQSSNLEKKEGTL